MSYSYNNLSVEKRADYYILTLNRPQSLNAFNIATFHELQDALAQISAEGARGLIITGAGRAFAAGADLSECVDAGIEENRAYAALAQETFSAIEALPVPVIAAVNGYALGGGCELALACDIRIGGEKAVFGMPEVTLGVIPCFGGTQRLPRLIGIGRAKELILTGRKVRAEEALSIGLISRIVPHDNLLQEADAMMSGMMSNSSTGMKYAKLALSGSGEMSLRDGLEFEKDLSAICYGLPDKQEGMRAFFEKRKPVFGRQ